MEARPISQTPVSRSRAGRATWRAFKRWLYWFHRWLGVVTCLLCVMWFLSGLVMLYVPFPSWSDAERIAALPAVDVANVRITPDDAVGKSGLTGMPSVRLEMFAGEPVYRISTGNGSASLSAVTGSAIQSVTQNSAAQHVASVFPSLHPAFQYEVDADQWTPTRRFDPHRPLYRFALNDDADTVVYVSSRTGEIVQSATFAERAWNWVGAVPHWIYFTPIRRDQELWRQAVMWLSGPLVIGAISGVWIGILRLRRRRTGRPLTSVSPYSGWMMWHHIAGLIGGIFLTTWIFSGWLSVNPFAWFARTQLSETQLAGYAGWTPQSQLRVTTAGLRAATGASDISLAWLSGQPLLIARSASTTKLLDPSDGAPLALSDESLITAARRMYPEAAVTSASRLTREHVYWYSHHDFRTLPAVEVRFDDPSATWIYLDPATGAVAALSDRSARLNRWLFDFLHDYDLPVLLRNRPARDILIWLLSLAGLVISVSGVVIGWRTLKRSV